MRIQNTIGEQRFAADLSAAVRDLATQLPLTVDLIDPWWGREDRPTPVERISELDGAVTATLEAHHD